MGRIKRKIMVAWQEYTENGIRPGAGVFRNAGPFFADRTQSKGFFTSLLLGEG